MKKLPVDSVFKPGLSGKFFSLVLIPLFLASCAASKTIYAPAEEPGQIGYVERQISDNRYRVTFAGGNDASMADVQDYALLRAAEVTLYENFDYFEVESRTTVPHEDASYSSTGAVAYQSPGATHTSCGLLGCETYREPGTIVYEERFPDADKRYTTSLEIVMLDTAVDEERAYSAREVIDRLQ